MTYSSRTCLIEKINKDLYSGSLLSADTSWCIMMHFAIENKLSYSAIHDLVELLKMHCPSSSVCPPSFYKLRVYFKSLFQSCTYLKYCSNCMEEIKSESSSTGVCSNKACCNLKAKTCSLALLPIEERIKELYLNTKCKI